MPQPNLGTAQASATDSHHVDGYSGWSSGKLVERVTSLEQQLRELTEKYELCQAHIFTSNACRYEAKRSPHKPPRPKKARKERVFDPTKYSTRLIALKLAYLGKNYHGFEHHVNNKTPFPTIEEALWKALMKARLIFPDSIAASAPGDVNWEGCEYSKCGRTDKGVSAFGQVIGLRVRSNRPLPKSRVSLEETVTSQSSEPSTVGNALANGTDAEPSTCDVQPAFDDVADEILYPQVLNRILPPEIRILAWCPQPPPGFSARFSCRERQYRYFFTQPAYCPDPTSPCLNGARREGWLNIGAMRTAAKKFEGLHDFQNFCKVDPGKQITDFSRRIFYSDIVEVKEKDQAAAFIKSNGFTEFPEDGRITNGTANRHGSSAIQTPKVYMFVLHGSAFLWHQVRCMVAMLFLIGQGLESPDLIDNLLDTKTTSGKPHYDLAEDVPLVLWDCIFPDEKDDKRKDSLNWVYINDQPEPTNGPIASPGSTKGGKYGFGGLVDSLWKTWRSKKMDEILAGQLLNAVISQGPAPLVPEKMHSEMGLSKTTQKTFLGGDGAERKGAYVPVLKRRRMESVEVQNQRYAERKGISPGERRNREDDRGDHRDDGL